MYIMQLHVYRCIYIYMYECAYIYIYVYMIISVYTYVYDIYIKIYIYRVININAINMFISLCARVCVRRFKLCAAYDCICMCICLCTFLCKCTLHVGACVCAYV